MYIMWTRTDICLNENNHTISPKEICSSYKTLDVMHGKGKIILYGQEAGEGLLIRIVSRKDRKEITL